MNQTQDKIDEKLSAGDRQESISSYLYKKKKSKQKNWWKNNVPITLFILIVPIGLILLASAIQAIYLLINEKPGNTVLILIVLCLIAAVLFFINAMILMIYCKNNYTNIDDCSPCQPCKSLNLLYQRSRGLEKFSGICEASHCGSNPIVCDVSTSFSQEKRRSSNSGFLGYRRSNNRIGVGPRREYVDRPTSPDQNMSVKLIENETQVIEISEIVDTETSAIATVEEKDAQTFSQCPACSATLECSPKGICPTFLALIQSFGMLPCSESIQIEREAPELVDRGTFSRSTSSFEVTDSTLIVTKKAPRVYETHACPTHGAGLIAQKAGLPNPVTRVSLPYSIRKSKKTQTSVIRPSVVTDKYQNTEINVEEKKTNTEGSQYSQLIMTEGSATVIKEESISKEESSSRTVLSSSEEDGNYLKLSNSSYEENTSQENMIVNRENEKRDSSSSGNLEASNRESSVLRKVEEENSFQKIRDTYSSPQQSSDKVEIASIQNSNITYDHDTTGLNARSSRNSNKPRKQGAPSLSCNCSQRYNYYKDVFGRYICSLCAHKYLIKIPQRYTMKPVGDIRCCSCSQAIFYQPPNATQTKCQRCCRCRYRMYMSNGK